VCHRLAFFAARFGLPPSDGVALLDELLTLAGYRDRETML
jgi:hypothetical protein